VTEMIPDSPVELNSARRKGYSFAGSRPDARGRPFGP